MQATSQQRRIARIMTSFAAVLIIGSVFAAAANACPTCKDGLAAGGNAGMVNGYFWSIIFMMSMPFIIFFSVGGYFYWEIRRARREQADAAAESALSADAT